MAVLIEVVIGIVGGVLVIAAAVYFAVRPYLKAHRAESWMPDPTGDAPPNHYAS